MSDDTNNDMVPRSRLNEVIAERNTALDQIKTLEAQAKESSDAIHGWKAVASESETLQAKVAELEASITSKEAAWGIDRAMLEQGITDSTTREFLAFKYGKEKDPPKFDTWLGKNQDTFAPLLGKQEQPQTAEDPAATPEATPDTPETPAGPQTAGQRLPSGNEGTRSAPTPGSVFDPASIARMSPEEYATHRDEILAGLA